MPIKQNQIFDEPKVLSSAAKPTTTSGQGSWYVKTTGGVAEGFYVDDQAREVQVTTNGKAGEINTASNVGSGSGLFKGKVGVDLQMKGLIPGANITITPGTNDITIAASGGGGGATLSRYVAYATSTEEVEVFATNTGITYARSGTTGTFTIPSGTRLMGARLRLPMATIGGTTFIIVFGTNGGFDGNTSYANMYVPMVQCWREDTGAQVAIASSTSAGFDRLSVSGLALNQSNMLRMQW